jgi:hypothetical protein
MCLRWKGFDSWIKLLYDKILVPTFILIYQVIQGSNVRIQDSSRAWQSCKTLGQPQNRSEHWETGAQFSLGVDGKMSGFKKILVRQKFV